MIVSLMIMMAFAAPGAARSDSMIKARLVSSGAGGEIDGTATLEGYDLHGQLVGNGTNAVLAGVVKSGSVSVEVEGKIAPNCGMTRQFMSGTGRNEGENTLITMAFNCVGKAGIGGGEEYQFTLHLGLPANALHNDAPSDPGEEASLE